MKIPKIFYGTAWKEEKTSDLCYQALIAGFRAVDTANQRKHYFEKAVGEGLTRFYAETGTLREDLFLQSKFTFKQYQDNRLPYDEGADTKEQVKQSFEGTLNHLDTDYLDSYLLHAPSSPEGLTDEDWQAWESLEQLQKRGKANHIGVSNFKLAQLAELCDKAAIKPKFIQNRCLATKAWDRDIRQFCESNGIIYQGFSLLTANSEVIQSATLKKIATKHKVTSEQIVFRFAQQIGLIPLTGTSSTEHMRLDLMLKEFELSPEEVEKIEHTLAN